MPDPTRCRMIRSRIGRPATRSIGFGTVSVSGRRRMPCPPAMTTARFVRSAGARNAWSRCRPTGRPSRVEDRDRPDPPGAHELEHLGAALARRGPTRSRDSGRGRRGRPASRRSAGPGAGRRRSRRRRGGRPRRPRARSGRRPCRAPAWRRGPCRCRPRCTPRAGRSRPARRTRGGDPRARWTAHDGGAGRDVGDDDGAHPDERPVTDGDVVADERPEPDRDVGADPGGASDDRARSDVDVGPDADVVLDDGTQC